MPSKAIFCTYEKLLRIGPLHNEISISVFSEVIQVAVVSNMSKASLLGPVHPGALTILKNYF